MTNEILRIENRVEIPPLRKCYPDGRLYFRREQVESELECLYGLRIEDVAERAKLTNPDDPDYISSEAVLHFVRQSKRYGDSLPYRTLFMTLRQRVMCALPVFSKRLTSGRVTDDPYENEVQERAVDKFTEMLCQDREIYRDSLDFFEVMFNKAIFALRQTAKRDTSKRLKKEKSAPLVIDEAVAGIGDDLEGVLRNLNEPPKNENFVYRFELVSAINDLPDDERRVVELLILGYKLKEVAEIVECTEKTARTRRDRARVRLAGLLEREDLL